MIIFFIAVSQKSPLLFQRCVNEIWPCWYGQCKLATLHHLFESLCLQRFPFLPLLLLSLLLVLPISLSLSFSPMCTIQERLFYSVCSMKGRPLWPRIDHSLVRKQGYRLSNWLSKVLEAYLINILSFFAIYEGHVV